MFFPAHSWRFNSAVDAPPTRFAVLLHWALALALIAQLVLGWWMLGVPKSPTGLRAGWFNLHKSIGLTIGALVLVRIACRAAHPLATHALPAWQRRAAMLTHVTLYACMAMIPLSGYLGSAFTRYPVRFFGHVLPNWAPDWPAAKESMSLLHEVLVWVFMALLAMHVAAAVWHWMRGDDVASRMGLPVWNHH